MNNYSFDIRLFKTDQLITNGKASNFNLLKIRLKNAWLNSPFPKDSLVAVLYHNDSQFAVINFYDLENNCNIC